MARPLLILGLLAAALWGIATGARAASIDELQVRQAAGRYLIEMRARLSAHAQDAYEVFANLGNLRAINSDVQEATILGRTGNGVRLYTVFRACVLWYCRSIRETQAMTFVRSPAGGEVDAVIVPGSGDFHSGHAHWSFRDSGGQTELDVTAELDPAFRIPPLIGPWLVRRWLRAETERATVAIERLASASSAVPHRSLAPSTETARGASARRAP